MKIINVSSVHNFYDTRIQAHLCSFPSSYFWGFCAQPNNKLFFNLGKTTAKKRLFFTFDAIFRLIFLDKKDIIVIHDPELLPLAFIIRLIKRQKVFFDAHEDILADVMHKHWLHPVLIQLTYFIFSILLRSVLPRLSGILTVTPSLVKYYSKFNDVVIYLPNWPVDFPSSHFVIEGKAIDLRHCYVGSISKQRGALEICNLAQFLKYPLLLVGSITDKDLKEQMMCHQGWKNIDYRGFIPNSRLKDILQDYDIGLLLLDDIDTFRNSVPVKIFDYARIGLLTLWTGRSDCEYAKLVTQFPNQHLAPNFASINFERYLELYYSQNCTVSGMDFSWDTNFKEFLKCAES